MKPWEETWVPGPLNDEVRAAVAAELAKSPNDRNNGVIAAECELCLKQVTTGAASKCLQCWELESR